MLKEARHFRIYFSYYYAYINPYKHTHIYMYMYTCICKLKIEKVLTSFQQKKHPHLLEVFLLLFLKHLEDTLNTGL